MLGFFLGDFSEIFTFLVVNIYEVNCKFSAVAGFKGYAQCIAGISFICICSGPLRVVRNESGMLGFV